MSGELWDVLAAELVDTLQADRMRRGTQMNVRTQETKRSWPLPKSRKKPLLICVYCGRFRCTDHDDLPPLDPYFEH